MRAGCCKTTLVRAAATASGAHVVALAGASLFSMYVGEGEALLRSAFQRARQAAPAIVFLDELDALVGAAPASKQRIPYPPEVHSAEAGQQSTNQHSGQMNLGTHGSHARACCV